MIKVLMDSPKTTPPDKHARKITNFEDVYAKIVFKQPVKDVLINDLKAGLYQLRAVYHDLKRKDICACVVWEYNEEFVYMVQECIDTEADLFWNGEKWINYKHPIEE